MDITMPEMNGIECLKKIRELSPQAKVVMITALGSADKMLEALDAGATNFISKSFEKDKIISVIGEVLPG